MPAALDFLWDCLDAYEMGYTTVLRHNKAVEKELLELRAQTVNLQLCKKFLTKENNRQKENNDKLQRELEDRQSQLELLQAEVEACRTHDNATSDCNSDRINYFADAILHQRDCYNKLNQDYGRLQKENQNLEMTYFSAQNEIQGLREEVERLREAADSVSQEEKILTSSFLHDFREKCNRALMPECTMTSYCCSETLIEDLAAESPHDLLRHRVLNLDGRGFEHFCCQLFECLGYKTTHRGGACDLGIDFKIKSKDSMKTWAGCVGQCKRYNRKIGSQEIREFAGSMLSQGCHTGYFLTTSSFTRDAKLARSKAEENFIMIELWDIQQICDKVREGGFARVLLEGLDRLAEADDYNIKNNTYNNLTTYTQKKQTENCCARTPSSMMKSVAGYRNKTNRSNMNHSSCDDVVPLEFDAESVQLDGEDNKENENDADLDDLSSSISNLQMGSVVDQADNEQNSSSTALKCLYQQQHQHDENQVPQTTYFLSTPDRGQHFSSTTPQTPLSSCGHKNNYNSSPATASRCGGLSRPGGNTPFRDSERWLSEEVAALEALVPRFTARTATGGATVAWNKMEQWLRENEAKLKENGGTPCALRAVHFDKNKLRSRWKNDNKKNKK